MLATVVATAFLMVAPGVAYVVIAVAAGIATVHPSSDQLLIAQLVTYVPWGVFLLLALPRISQTSLHDLGFRRPTGRDLSFALGGAVVMWIATEAIGLAVVSLTHLHETEAAVALLRGLRTPAERTMYVAIAVVLAPMLEELTFRVFIFNAVSRYASVLVAALVSGLIFGLAHVQPQSSHDVVPQLLTISLPLFAGGIVLAYVYASTRCYWANVITHGTFNAVTVVAVMAFHAN